RPTKRAAFHPAVAGADHEHVVVQVEFGVEAAQSDGQWRRGESPSRDVERHVRPARLERAEGKAKLADHLRVHVERVASLPPLHVWESQPPAGGVVHVSMMMLTGLRAARDRVSGT